MPPPWPGMSTFAKPLVWEGLRKVHGSTKNRGSAPSHHVNGSGSVDRKVMQALEKIGVLEQDEEKGGRRITQSGQRDLDRKSLPPSFEFEGYITWRISGDEEYVET